MLVIGIIGGLGAVRNATNGELMDLAEAIEAINVQPGSSLDDDHHHQHHKKKKHKGHQHGHGHDH